MAAGDVQANPAGGQATGLAERPGPCRAPFAYYGGKAGMAQRIIDLMPEHRVYMEPFFGSGAVFFAKPPARFEIINDLNRNVTTFFKVLRERPEDLAATCLLTPHSRTEYVDALFDEDLDEMERARRFWIRVNQSFAKSDGRQTGWSVTTARSQSVAAGIVSRVGRFADAAGRLMLASIECCDAAGLVERLATPDTVIYVDPPYLAETRRGRDRQRPGDYLHDMGEPEEHERLAEVLAATDARVILSGYPSPLYDRLYADWWYEDLAVNVHASMAVPDGRGQRVERLWCNYEPVARAADWTLFDPAPAARSTEEDDRG